MSPSKALDNLYAAGLIHPSREHSRQATLPSDNESQEVANLVTQQTNNDTADVMLLKRWNGKLLAEQFGLPGMELEIERAVEQVQKTIEIEGERKTPAQRRRKRRFRMARKSNVLGYLASNHRTVFASFANIPGS
ncbi:unnamed protein product [Aureobasidium pullulans]|nr:unnamed protein product [Aureobasidium pullulans]